jgi:probable rRNA maturation factor
MANGQAKDDRASIDFRGFPSRFQSLKAGFTGVARRILAEHGVDSYAVSISFVSNDEISSLNQERLGRSGPTDVIAFDLSEPGFPLEKVGDVYISTDTAYENSERFGVRPEEELLRLVVHGVLHVLGYTDHDPEEALKMKQLQERMVKDFQRLADSDEE